jgi:hypothetical protein
MQASLETGRIHSLMERLNSKNPVKIASCYGTVSTSLPPEAPARVSENAIDRSAPSSSQLDSVQALLNRLQYNCLPQTFFCLEKNRPFYRIAGTAKEILQESLPIRCLEATFLALHLTCPLKDVERFPISFKSRASTGQTHRHIVLGVKHRGLYGALGLSRSLLLMNKPIIYKSIGELLNTYISCYQQVGHQLISFKLGLFVTHDPYSKVTPCWRFISLTPSQPCLNVQDCVKTATTVEHFELLLPVLSDQFLRLGSVAGDSSMTPVSSPASVATPSSYTKPPFSPSATSCSPTTQADDDEVSDSEENQRRISCVIAMSSPFSPLSSSTSAAAQSTTDQRSKFSSRLRRAVHENPLDGCGSTSCDLPTSRRSRTVPASRRSRNSSTSEVTSVTPPPVVSKSTGKDPMPVDQKNVDVHASSLRELSEERIANEFLDKINLEPSPACAPPLMCSSSLNAVPPVGPPSAVPQVRNVQSSAALPHDQGLPESNGATKGQRASTGSRTNMSKTQVRSADEKARLLPSPSTSGVGKQSKATKLIVEL